MEYQEGKEKFIQAFGTLGSKWGINRTMAQVHALLLISPGPLCADDIMSELSISRGNANMNLRALIDWGLIYKELKAGERKEFFVAEKDMWKVVRQIMLQRKKRELAPIMEVLSELNEQVQGEGEEVEVLKKSVADMHNFGQSADKAIEKVVNSDENWLFNTFLKMLMK